MISLGHKQDRDTAISHFHHPLCLICHRRFALVHSPSSDIKVRRPHNIAKEVDSTGYRPNDPPVRVKLKPEGFHEECADLFCPVLKYRTVSVKQDQIVHITNVPLGLQPVFHELVKGIQVNIGKELTGEVPDGQPLSPAD